MKIFEIICMFFFLSSCTNTTFIQEDSKTINIDVAKSIKFFDADKLLDTIGHEIIVLDTAKNSFIGHVNKLLVTEDKLYIWDRDNKVVFIYSPDGKYLSRIASQGRAKNEYVDIDDFYVSKNRIYILDNATMRLLEYDITGGYIKTLDISRYWANGVFAINDMIYLINHDSDTHHGKYHIFEIQYQNGGLGLGNQMLFEACPSLYSAYTIVRIFGNHIYCERRLSEEFQKIYNEKMDARCLATIDTTKFVNTDGATPIKYTGDDFFIKFLEHKMKRSQLGYSDIDNSIVDVKDWPINHPIIRLEDVMLMYAEIVGPTTEGLNMVNRIRTRAGMDAIPACSDAEFQKYVERERRLELAFEGIRWHDLVRHNNLQAIRDMYTRYATNEETGQVNADILAFAQNVKDNMYIYPIPEAQMKVKEGLYKQNEAYK